MIIILIHFYVSVVSGCNLIQNLKEKLFEKFSAKLDIHEKGSWGQCHDLHFLENQYYDHHFLENLCNNQFFS
jgi:hypothetical protein